MSLTAIVRTHGLGFWCSVVALVFGCGSQSTSANPGSETHWLGECNADADCAVGQCACGVCTKACDAEDDCNLGSGIDAQCREGQAEDRCSSQQSTAKWCLTSEPALPDSAPSVSTEPVATDPEPTTSEPVTPEPTTSESTAPEPTASEPSPSASDSTDEPPPEPKVICDGSNEVRFVANTDGGFVDQFYAFMEYGHQLLAIDGQCNYWVTVSADGQVHTGQVTEAEAQDLALQASYGNWSSFGGYRGSACPDGAGSILWDGNEFLSCTCACGGEDAPAGYPEAFAASRMLATDLFAMGDPTAEGLQLLLVAYPPEAFNDEGLPWPLDWDPATAAIDDEQTFSITADSGQPVDDEQERASLRSFRAEYLEQFSFFNAGGMHVVAAAGDGGAPVHYQLMLRDDVPAAVSQARLDARDAVYAQ